MKLDVVEQVADAVLYEGYVLYPYRASAVKNRQRWNFGGLFPKAYSEAQKGSDAWTMQTECLIEQPIEKRIEKGDRHLAATKQPRQDRPIARSQSPFSTHSEGRQPTVDIKVRFLQISIREAGRLTSPESELLSGMEPEYEVVDSVLIEGKAIHTWQEALERDVCLRELSLSEIAGHPLKREFSFPADCKMEIHRGGGDEDAAVIVRRQLRIDGIVEISAEAIADGLFRLRVVVRNNTPIDNPASTTRDEAALYAMASTHIILGCQDGEFVSLMDPPDRWLEFAAGCKNVGAWPVLVGDEPHRNLMLASPIILYDYPQIAPESAGELFDGTEIDEILTLRIMSLTDEEKQEMRSLDDRTRAILDRTENLPADQLAKLHGAVRGLRQFQGEIP